MDFYQQVLDKEIEIKDLDDSQLETLCNLWMADGVTQPPEPVFTAARAERRRREVDRASKPRKTIDRGFFG